MHDEGQDTPPVEGECNVAGLIRKVKEKEKELWRCLHSELLRRRHPVATYHLEQIASHLHSILFYLKPQQEVLDEDEWGQASLCSLLDQLDKPSQLSEGSAWELSGEFERQLIDLGDDTYLYTLLKDQIGSEDNPESGPKRVPTIADWQDYFPRSDLTRLCEDYKRNGGAFSDDRTRSEVRDALRHLHLARFEEYRRYRTKLRLRTRYLRRMTPWLIGLLIILCVAYLQTSLQNTYVLGPLVPPPSDKVPPSIIDKISIDTIRLGNEPLPTSERPHTFVAYLLFFVFSAGALGALLGRAFTLGSRFPREGAGQSAREGARQSARGRNEVTDDEASFGIRWMLAVGQGIRAQVVIGGTSALVIFLALQLFDPPFPSVAYGLIGFLTGYSEPFFSRTLQETTAWGQRLGGM